jgi:hypothetical protein
LLSRTRDRIPAFPAAALLIAPASVFSLMSRNLDQTSFSDVLSALLGSLCFAVLVWLVAIGLRWRCDAKAAAAAAVWVAGALFYLGLFGPLNAWIGGGYPMVKSLPLALGALALVTLVVLRLPEPLVGALHLVMSTMAAVVLASPLWSAVAYEWRNGDARAAYDADRAAEMVEIAASDADADGARPPDIYHFVFDRYGSADTLESQYGVTEGIGGFLEARGFYVATDSYSNYLRTGHSLASTFYMDYLDFLAEDPRVPPSSWHPIFRMLDDHRVGRFLKSRGYRIVQFGSWWVGTFDSAVADENHPHGFSEFNMLYLRRTILRPIFHALPDTPFTMRLDWDNGQCQRVARQVDQIKTIGRREDPVYVFAHILVPHGPYIFASDGSCLTPAQAIERGDERGYATQIAYANRIIRDVVTALQAPDRDPPIILIQADEGPFPERDGRVPWQDAPAEELRIKTGILNAFYFPDQDYRQLSPQITPVNAYRVVFNAQFGTELPQLPDRIVAFSNDARLYEFHDVTERVRNEPSSGQSH